MIERLIVSLRALAGRGRIDPHDPADRRLLDDCADALRLELDCPQQTLTDEQRDAAGALSDRLESPVRDGSAIAAAVRELALALDVATTDPDARAP
ncbi:MAG TPA: hypothetical protein VEA99_12710 [Gemmatimonadaceae bacterium]|nr:hypothetical protein [Gemmatimonadaceae bacterium]